MFSVPKNMIMHLKDLEGELFKSNFSVFQWEWLEWTNPWNLLVNNGALEYQEGIS